MVWRRRPLYDFRTRKAFPEHRFSDTWSPHWPALRLIATATTIKINRKINHFSFAVQNLKWTLFQRWNTLYESYIFFSINIYFILSGGDVVVTSSHHGTLVFYTSLSTVTYRQRSLKKRFFLASSGYVPISSII